MEYEIMSQYEVVAAVLVMVKDIIMYLLPVLAVLAGINYTLHLLIQVVFRIPSKSIRGL